MAVHSKYRQRGITFFGLLFAGTFVAVAFIVLAQVFPTYVEYQTISKAVNKAAGGSSVAEIRGTFDAAAAIDNISSIKGGDLEITKEGDKVVVKFDYQAEIHLVGPAWLIMKYSGRSK